ncbi:MAG: hypothetical protein U9R26_04105 [Campylobacterota bacterium]|nr:hypothetical protein [Campylobacterota bacterium]
MTAIKIDDPVIEKIIRQQGIETITNEILTFIKGKFLPREEKLENNNKRKSRTLAKSFLSMTEQTKEELSRSYSAKEAKDLYRDSQR